ncbi:MAG: DNRLRE domain-containing protein [Verrucomicrobia bacterium]|nr:DNRLRE domain-containing protein [Verrucomicrobiota bacterium]
MISAGLLLLQTVGGRADPVLLYPVADTTLSENWAANNLGGLPFINAGTTQNFTTNRALLRFDLAGAIPAGSVITSVALTLEVTREPGDGYNLSDFGLHRVLRDWGEGDNVTPSGSTSPGSGAPADPGEANWFHRFASTANSWGIPGGEADVDYASLPSAAITIYGVGDSPYVFGSTPALVADAQLWLDQPQRNFGWMLISQSETLDFTARRFGSREDPLNTPYLSVDFISVPEPPAAALLLLGFIGAICGRRLRFGSLVF